MRGLISSLFIAVTVILATASTVLAASTHDPQSHTAGGAIFNANCAVCHGQHGEGGIGPNLQQIAARRSFDDTVAFIENPLGPMPKLFPEKLNEQQVRQVATYIRTQLKSAALPNNGSTWMGPGMMQGPGMMHGSMMYGMMYGYGPGGYGPGMMPGMMGRYPPGGQLNLTVDNVKTYFQRWLTAQGNPHVKLGAVRVRDADTIIADIVTADTGSLVVRYAVNRHTGYVIPQ